MNLRTAILFALFVFGMTPAASFAQHEAGEHIRGTVASIKPGHVRVTTADSKQVTVAFNEQTTFEKGGAPSGAKHLAVGQQVVVLAQKSPSGTEHVALNIKMITPTTDTKEPHKPHPSHPHPVPPPAK